MADDNDGCISAEERHRRAVLPPAERQAILKNLFVGHTRFQVATERIARFHRPVVGGAADYGSVFVLFGCPRAGKSFVLDRYAERFPPDLEGAQGVVRPVVYADLPTDCSKRGFVEALAAALNVECVAKGGIDATFGNVLNAIARQGVELILLDEVQEAFAASRPAALKQARGLLRKILNLRTCNVVCAGLEETYAYMNADRQLRGRGLLPRHLIEPYDWAREEDQELFRVLCDYVDERLPFEQKSGLGRRDAAWRLHWVCGGIIGPLKDFVHGAGCLAINDGAPRLNWSHMADFWDGIKPLGTIFNPFRDDMGTAPQSAEPPPPAKKGEPHPTFQKT